MSLMFRVCAEDLKNIDYRDIEHSKSPIFSAEGHKQIISSIDGVAGDSIGCGAPEIVTGSHDGIKYP